MLSWPKANCDIMLAVRRAFLAAITTLQVAFGQFKAAYKAIH